MGKNMNTSRLSMSAPMPKNGLRYVAIVAALLGGAITPSFADEPLYEINKVPTDSERTHAPMAEAPPSLPILRGQLRPRQHTILAASMDGTLSAMPVIVGGRVDAGDLLAEFLCTLAEANRSIAQARLQAVQATQDVNARLSQTDSISTLEVELSAADLIIRTEEMKQAGDAVAKCRVTAPFSGTIVEKFVEAHQYVRTGEPLMRLVNAQDLEVEAIVPSDWLSWLGPQSPFTLSIDETMQQMPGHVIRIVDEVDPVSRTIKVIGKLDNAHETLLPGMSGSLLFER